MNCCTVGTRGQETAIQMITATTQTMRRRRSSSRCSRNDMVVKAGTPPAGLRRQPGQPRLPGPATSTGISSRCIGHFTPWPAPWQRKPGSPGLGDVFRLSLKPIARPLPVFRRPPAASGSLPPGPWCGWSRSIPGGGWKISGWFGSDP